MESDLLFSRDSFGCAPGQVGRGPLHPGAVFEGRQQSGRNSYKVKVTIETVDIPAGTLCGLLEIHGLTPQLDSLVTFFEGEIIGTRSGFVTGRWGASEADDFKHWNRFAPFRTIKNSLTKPALTYNHLNRPFLFMRWKERFVVPEYKVQNINGASYSGFYFLCLEFNDPSSTSLVPSVERERGRTSSPGPRRLSIPTPVSPPPVTIPLVSSTPRPDASLNNGRARSVSRTAGTVSYAAAVRGSSRDASLPLSSPARASPNSFWPAMLPTLASNATETPAKDGPTAPTTGTLPFPSSSDAPSSSSSSSSLLDEQDLQLPITINLPTPQGTTEADFPVPSSPPSQPPVVARRSSVESVVTDMEREREKDRIDRDKKSPRPTSGGIMTNATITGWYFFKHSEPFQQLSLRYVPQLNGGSQSFAFR